MTASKHTPGPWRVAEPVCSVGRTVWRGDADTNANWHRICRNVTNPADAALIAAAPELLAALQTMLTFESLIREHRPSAVYTLERARAALAKAEDGK